MSVTYSNPRVAENIFNLVTLLWICLQQSPDQIFGCMREKRTLLQEEKVMTNKPHSTTMSNSTTPQVSLKLGRPGINPDVWKEWHVHRRYTSLLHIVNQLQTHTLYMYMQLTVIIGGGTGGGTLY